MLSRHRSHSLLFHRSYHAHAAVVALAAASFLAVPAFAQGSSKQWVEQPTVASPIAGQKRFALIIGNANYGPNHDLKNPGNDARDIAVALGKLGFSSTVLLDGSREQMRDSVHTFADTIRAAGDQSVALLFYSGHGMQVDGENYLLPIGFHMPAHRADIGDYALSAQKALDEMQHANAQVNIAILDACRDNPFEGSRSIGGKGLTKLETQGMLIAYATAAGRTADDNQEGQNGLYTGALIKNLLTPGLRLYDIFKKTTKMVYETSNHEQYPYLYDGLIDDGEFYLLPPVAATANPEVVKTAVSKPALLAHGPNSKSYENQPRYKKAILAYTKKAYATALPLLTTFAKEGDALAQSDLGTMYANGYGVSKNAAEAVRLFKLSADQGNPKGLYNLGVMYDNGDGVIQNVAEAARLYKLSADQGYDFGQNNLGSMYENGDGVTKNLAEAIRLYKLAAAQGNTDAKANLKRLGQ